MMFGFVLKDAIRLRANDTIRTNLINENLKTF